uniref:Uncharacterized protein n=1 Tax=Arundo donax TaxID=35708 RepID=A0A0A9H5T9_ARUDO
MASKSQSSASLLERTAQSGTPHFLRRCSRQESSVIRTGDDSFEDFLLVSSWEA